MMHDDGVGSQSERRIPPAAIAASNDFPLLFPFPSSPAKIIISRKSVQTIIIWPVLSVLLKFAVCSR